MNEQPSSTRLALKWGVILGIVLMLITLVLYLTDQTTNPWFSVLTLAVMIAALILAMQEYRKVNGGFMSYGEGVGMGALLSGVAGILASAFSTFYNVVIDPTIQQRAFEQARERLENQNMSDEQIDQALEFSQKFQSPGFTFIAGVFGTIIMGALLSLIIAAFIRRNKNNPFD
ncbi:DUF4199 domain-containing protein [Spirosoma sp. SC4-14]|uniref:DUF4199 domain-containing protein n=1 Tax=Spirosoma sp. SC4-14 TaxID=3128900 RepID=UPI0030D2B231